MRTMLAALLVLAPSIFTKTAEGQKSARSRGRELSRAEIQSLDPGELLWLVAEEYQVPVCALFGIWTKESSRLDGGWKCNGADWVPAAQAVKPGGACLTWFRRDAEQKCARHWQALQAICSQKVKIGSRAGQALCDPQAICASPALAMGPMQQMPGEIAEPCPDDPSRWCYTDRAVDFDGDGVVDPHSLADSLAMAATQIRRYHEQWGSWRRAVIRYYGVGREGIETYAHYHDGGERETKRGKRWSHGVAEYWKQCREGLCRQGLCQDSERP